jgi:hypothetical protein
MGNTVPTRSRKVLSAGKRRASHQKRRYLEKNISVHGRRTLFASFSRFSSFHFALHDSLRDTRPITLASAMRPMAGLDLAVLSVSPIPMRRLATAM